MSIYLSVCTDRVVLNGFRVNESGHFSKYLSWCPWQLATWLKVTLMYCYEILERQQICVNTVALSSPQELLGIQSTDVSQLQTKGSNGSSKPRDIYKRPTCTKTGSHSPGQPLENTHFSTSNMPRIYPKVREEAVESQSAKSRPVFSAGRRCWFREPATRALVYFSVFF